MPEAEFSVCERVMRSSCRSRRDGLGCTSILSAYSSEGINPRTFPESVAMKNCGKEQFYFCSLLSISLVPLTSFNFRLPAEGCWIISWHYSLEVRPEN